MNYLFMFKRKLTTHQLGYFLKYTGTRLRFLDLVFSWLLVLPSVSLKYLRRRLTRKWHLSRQNPPEYDCAIVRPGGMGDLILAGKAFDALNTYSGKAIWLIQKRGEAWAIQNRMNYVIIDDISFINTIVNGIQCKYIVNSEQYYGLGAIIALAIARSGSIIAGFCSNRLAWTQDLTAKYQNKSRHEYYSFLDLFSLVCGNSDENDRNLLVRRSKKKQLNGILAIGIAGFNCQSRSLSVELWEKYTKIILKEGTYRCVSIICQASDLKFGSALARRLGSNLDITVNIISGGFAQACSAIKNADRVLTIDGGLVHVSSYYNVPVDAIFTAGDPCKWHPLEETSTIIKSSKKLKCMPCTYYGKISRCMLKYECRNSLKESYVRTPIRDIGQVS